MSVKNKENKQKKQLSDPHFDSAGMPCVYMTCSLRGLGKCGHFFV